MHGCQSAWQRRRQRGRHEWRIEVFVCDWRLWLVDRGRRCTTVPVHTAPCMSADTAWTGRAVAREANESGPAARAWYDPASWRRQLIVLLCSSSQTAAGRVDSVELQPADCYSTVVDSGDDKTVEYGIIFDVQDIILMSYKLMKHNCQWFACYIPVMCALYFIKVDSKLWVKYAC